MKTTLITGLVALSLSWVPILQGSEVDRLEATNEAEVAALHARDVEAYLATLHPEEVSMFATEAFPVDYKGQPEKRRRAVEGFFANLEQLRITSINKHYRVVDTTGLVWGHVKIETKLKDGPLQIRYYRGMWVYTKSGDDWLRVARHVSAIPQGN
jgi:ketosteroid isomerase-like protein